MKTGTRITALAVPGGQGLLYPTLIWDDDTSVLVDAAYPGEVSYFKEAITQAGGFFEKIDKIIITHRDWDHTGGLVEIIRELPKRPVVMAEAEEKPFIDDYIAPLECVLIKDGETLPFCSGITVIHTPGHKPGHVCLYVSRKKTLIAADALAVENEHLTLPPKSVNLDWCLARDSLRKLLEYDIETVICYHGGVWSGNVNRSIIELLG